MSTQLKKGILDICVLSVLSQKRMYGYGLKVAMEPLMDLSENTLYPLLRRLEKDGYLSTNEEESNEGRIRKYYEVTQEGEIQLEKLIEEWHGLNKIVDEVIKRRKNND